MLYDNTIITSKDSAMNKANNSVMNCLAIGLPYIGLDLASPNQNICQRNANRK